MGGKVALAFEVEATVDRGEASRAVFDRIRDFLEANRLGPDPVNYAFGYRVVSDPAGPLARAVAALTDGGVRLTKRDILALGGDVSNAPIEPPAAAASSGQGLVAQTQMQVEGFQDLVRAMRNETADFGRDLAATADAMRVSTGIDSVSEVLRMTGAMLNRVQNAESQLEVATREASDLRAKLEEARDNARRDPLTGLPNRRAFEEAYADHVAKGSPICVAVCDIDHFKLVNDGFGHAVGDRVLKAIGDVLAEQCGEHLVARYGGEEFVVLFAGIPLAAGQDMLESARQLVAKKRYRLRESDEPLGEVTFSAGLTAASSGEDVGDVFVRADGLLYAAKADGRNCLKIG
ncbi:MAG: GGDEF domain-containing protein [Sphingomonas sp. 32-62-10]|nr:MAG: GGDEF domain-containing protein [Sphingomonas sp. 32-62-10]